MKKNQYVHAIELIWHAIQIWLLIMFTHHSWHVSKMAIYHAVMFVWASTWKSGSHRIWKMIIINAHAQLSSGTTELMIGCGLLLLSHSVYASIDGFCVPVRMRTDSPRPSMLTNAMNNNISCTDLITLFIIYSIIMLFLYWPLIMLVWPCKCRILQTLNNYTLMIYMSLYILVIPE